MSKTAFYRWRSKLLPYGVDIAITRPRLVETETRYLLGAPLKSFIEGPGEPPPAWAKRERLQRSTESGTNVHIQKSRKYSPNTCVTFLSSSEVVGSALVGIPDE
jgi:hypothetical protein